MEAVGMKFLKMAKLEQTRHDDETKFGSLDGIETTSGSNKMQLTSCSRDTFSLLRSLPLSLSPSPSRQLIIGF